MSAFIVSGGALLEVRCPSALSHETQQQVGFTSTLGGKRKAFIRKGGRRTWSVDVSVARPGDVAAIDAVARSGGPVGWYGPDAAVGNLVSPQSASFAVTPSNSVDGGLVALPNGQVASSVVHSGTASVTLGPAGAREQIPVLAGSPMTVGSWATGGLRISGIWLDAAGVGVSSFTTDAWELVGWEWREQTLTPPPDAVAFTFNLNGGIQYAAPSAAWGTQGRQAGGSGCPTAIVHAVTYSAIALTEFQNLASVSYMVTEVG